MHLDSPAVVLDVRDPDASRDFLIKHLGFTVATAGEAAGRGFTALAHPDHALRIIVRQLAAGATPPDFESLQIGFLVTGVDEHWARLKDTMDIVEPIHTLALDIAEPSQAVAYERAFRIADPNGIGYRLIEFVA
ncbi:VOC family protein [Streptomyces millisiae]|uniref:VOC family protein n=1 Tax=Streptomyces millisiae TaxID=3075542 RepID=A0ABU2LJU6_9ACTN|nr:VOC family protein [Streptomyces sp. DSM 44918]MDT0317859.1 VOC family protein [Streptomyces sp. DSM 44918]